MYDPTQSAAGRMAKWEGKESAAIRGLQSDSEALWRAIDFQAAENNRLLSALTYTQVWGLLSTLILFCLIIWRT